MRTVIVRTSLDTPIASESIYAAFSSSALDPLCLLGVLARHASSHLRLTCPGLSVLAATSRRPHVLRLPIHSLALQLRVHVACLPCFSLPTYFLSPLSCRQSCARP